jgi:hypothetical protein
MQTIDVTSDTETRINDYSAERIETFLKENGILASVLASSEEL